MICRTRQEAFDAGMADGAADPPLSQELADLIAAILAARQPRKAAAA